MSARPGKQIRSAPTDATMDAGGVSPASGDRRLGHAMLVEGTGPRFSDDTACKLQCRLRSAALILLLGFGLFLVRPEYLESGARAGYHPLPARRRLEQVVVILAPAIDGELPGPHRQAVG